MTTHNDVVTHYRMVPEDFVKHLVSTLVLVVVVVLAASLFFGVPEQTPLTIKTYATQHPVAFEQMALRALDGQGQIANYGPPYNHGTGSIQTPLQSVQGLLHPINAASDFIIHPLTMAASLNPEVRPALTTWTQASPTQRTHWALAYTKALSLGTYKNGTVVTPRGDFGPLPLMLNTTLQLGKSGLMSGALMRSGVVYTRFNTQNYLLFLQGAPLQQDPATQALLGNHWGIIHPAVAGYPGAWWMTIPTWIYQWPFVVHSKAPDAMALAIGFLFWLTLAFIPWIPGLNRLPRYLGIHKLIWKTFYHNHPPNTGNTKGESLDAS